MIEDQIVLNPSFWDLMGELARPPLQLWSIFYWSFTVVCVDLIELISLKKQLHFKTEKIHRSKIGKGGPTVVKIIKPLIVLKNLQIALKFFTVSSLSKGDYTDRHKDDQVWVVWITLNVR